MSDVNWSQIDELGYASSSGAAERQTSIEATVDFLGQYNPFLTPFVNDSWARGLLTQMVEDPDKDLDWFTGAMATDPRGQALLLQNKDIIGGSGGSGVSREQRIANIEAGIRDTASQFGLSLTEDRINSLAVSAVNDNWDNNLLIDNLLQDVDPSLVGAGDLTAGATALKETAASFNYELDDATARAFALNIARGDASIEGITEQIRTLSVNQNSEYAKVLSVGGDVQAYETNKINITANALRFGLTLDEETINTLAQSATLQNWDDQQLATAMFEGIDASYEFNTGTVTGLQDSIKAMGANYLMPVSDETAMNMALQQVRGELDEAGIQAMFTQQAKGQFSWMSDLIDQGITPSSYFAPSKEYLAETLEMNVDDIDLINSPRWRDMMIVNENGQTRSATLSELGRSARQTKEWRQTESARSTAQQLVSRLARTFQGGI